MFRKAFWAVLGLVIGLITCTPRYTIKITLDPQIQLPPQQKLQVFLLDETTQNNIEQIRTSNQTYFARAAYRFQDSLRVLYRQYILAAADKAKFESSYQSQLENYRQNLLKAQSAECLQVLRNNTLWQLRLKISNQSAEQVKGITLSIYFNRTPLVQSQFYALTILPFGSSTLNNVYFDLTDNSRLQYSLATYPGGLEKLTQALTIKIEEVKSDYAQFFEEHSREAQLRTNAELESALLMEDYVSNQVPRELQRLSTPLNQILINNLKAMAPHSATLGRGDTVAFTRQPEGRYYLIAFKHPEDTLQWLQPISLSQDYSLTLRPEAYYPYFIRVTPEIINRIANIVPELK